MTAPAYWADYLISGNARGLHSCEKLCADEWMKEFAYLFSDSA